MRGTLGITMAVLVVLAATGSPAGSQTAPAGELRIAYGAIGSNRHPHGTQILPDDDINNMIFDPLLTLTAQGTIELVLATSAKPLGETRWRFTLRPGVKFHDGSPLTAADAKFSLENYMAPESTAAMHKEWLDRVEVVDDLTFDVVSKSPHRTAIAKLAYLSHIIPRTATDPKAFAQHPIGTGPYRFVEFVPGSRVVLEANPNYWGPKKPSFKRIVFRQIVENATRVAALTTGEVDFATNIPPDDIARLKGAGLEISSVPSNRPMFIRFNLSVDGPWKDVRVRRALNHAVDREAIRQALLGGYGANAMSPITSGTAYVRKNLPRYDFDPARAKRLLAEAGYPNGFETTLATPNGRYLKDREVAEAVAGQLEAVGVRLRIVPLEWATYMQQLRTEKDTTGRKYPLSLMAWGNVLADPDFGLVPFETGNPWNLGGYSSPKLDGLIHQGRVTFEEAKLRAIYGEAQELVWNDAPWIFLFELPIIDAHSPKLKGHVPRPDEQHRFHLITIGK